MEKKFEKFTFGKRLDSMLNVDFRRMFTIPFFYILVGIAFVVPILILVMTTMMDGAVSVDPNGNQTVMEGFDFVWQILGSVSSTGQDSVGAMSMDLVSMCNINMLYFAVAVLVCVFVADDFRSGYAKNLFTVRSKKTDYVISKTLVTFVGGAIMILAFVVGALIGGGVSGLSFEMQGFNWANILACVISKMLLVSIFVAIYLLMSVIAKQKLWLSILLSLAVGMLLFNVAPMVSPLDANAIHIILSLVGGTALCVGLGAISNLILKKTSLV
ncbi:MAG: ABC transporter permease [Clostridia bacterium]|nr:ABC transporter permease [Clostridia bacterium]